MPLGEGPTGCRRERKQERGRSQERRQPSSSSSEKQRFYSCDRFGSREPPQPKPSLSSHPTSPTAALEPGSHPQVTKQVAVWFSRSNFAFPGSLSALCAGPPRACLSSHCVPLISRLVVPRQQHFPLIALFVFLSDCGLLASVSLLPASPSSLHPFVMVPVSSVCVVCCLM